MNEILDHLDINPRKPGHGRGSAPYGQSDSTSRPWAGPSWTVEKNAPVAKRSLLNIARNFSGTPKNSLVLLKTLYLLARSLLPFITFVQGRPESQSAGLWPWHRLNQPASRIQRIEGP